MNVKTRFAVGALVLLGISLPAALSQVPYSGARKKIASEADLPRFSYSIATSASDLLQSDDATFKVFAARVLADVDSVLTGYEIEDKATLRELNQMKLDILEIQGRNEEASSTLRALKGLQVKPGARETTGLLDEAFLDAARRSHSSAGEDYDAAFLKALQVRTAALDWTIVQDTIKETKGEFEFVTPNLIVGSVKANIDQAVAKSNSVDFAAAARLVSARNLLKMTLPLKQQILAVLTPYIATHNVQEPDIWDAREVTLTATEKLTPVPIGIWDSGVDTSLYPGLLYSDPAPGAHSPHGLAFDIHGALYNGDLQPLTDEQKAFYPTFLSLSQGLDDLQSNIDSPAATAVKTKFASTPPDQAAPLLKQLRFFGQWTHGTHVAGIAVRGNPAARLVVAQFYDSLPEIPFAPTVEWANQFKADFKQVGDYFRLHNVRVVNMSWGDDQAEIEQWLTRTSAEKDATKRKQFAGVIYRIWRSAVEDAITSAPDTLFICAAGNSDSDSQFTETIPAAFHLPNLIAVGAVDQAGEQTSFTSYGDTVKVDADGFRVESYVPGGTRLKESGTSMASPNVVNLAAKLFALNPSLKPADVIALIEQGADSSADSRRHLINPKATVALLASRKALASK